MCDGLVCAWCQLKWRFHRSLHTLVCLSECHAGPHVPGGQCVPNRPCIHSYNCASACCISCVPEGAKLVQELTCCTHGSAACGLLAFADVPYAGRLAQCPADVYMYRACLPQYMQLAAMCQVEKHMFVHCACMCNVNCVWFQLTRHSHHFLHTLVCWTECHAGPPVRGGHCVPNTPRFHLFLLRQMSRKGVCYIICVPEGAHGVQELMCCAVHTGVQLVNC